MSHIISTTVMQLCTDINYTNKSTTSIQYTLEGILRAVVSDIRQSTLLIVMWKHLSEPIYIYPTSKLTTVSVS